MRSSSGTSSVRISRARWLRVARSRPWCQPRTSAATAEGSAKPSPFRVRKVSGSSSTPVKTRLPGPERLGACSNSSRVVPLDRGQVAAEVGDKGVGLRVAEEHPDPRDAGAVRRQGVGLRVVDHLQPVLEAAQEAIIVGQRRRRRPIDAAELGKAAQRLAGRPDAQFRRPPAPDQLLGLGEELDLADAAAAELDVVAFDRDPAAAAMRVDLALDRVDVRDRREIEVLAPDEGLQFAQKPVGGGAVAGHGAGLDQRGPLPVLADALVIGQRGGDRHRQRGRGRVRPQPQIGAEDVAIAGAFVENAHQVAGEADEEGLRAGPRGHPRLCRIEQKDQVDIARVIELAAAELAHAEDNEPAVALGLLRIGELDRAAARRLAQQMAQRRAQRRVGKAAQRGGLLFERPDPGELGHGGEQRDPAPGDSQPAHQSLDVFARILRRFDGRDGLGEQRIGAGLDQAGQKGPLAQRDVAEKRAVAENRREQAPAGRRRAPAARGLGLRVAARRGQRLLPGFEPEAEPARVGRLRQPAAVGGEPR